MPTQHQFRLQENIQRLLRRNAERNLAKILHRTHVADIAAVMRSLNQREQHRLFELIGDPEDQAEVLAHADPEIQEGLLDHLPDEHLVELLELLSSDDAADLFELLDEDRAAAIQAQWKGEEAEEVDTLLRYGGDTAGGIMSPDVFALPADTTVSEAIATLQASHEDLEMAFYLYVVNDHGHLVGVCSLRQLVVSDPDTRLSDIMAAEVFSVDVNTDQEEVARLVARYNFLAIPVVDGSNRLVGIVTVDDVIDVIREEATEDILMMVGAGSADLSEQLHPVRNARLRMPWLLASFFGGVGSMFIIAAFEDSLMRVSALAAFIPITLGMGGNVGTQAATIVTRGLALGRVDVSRFASVVGREIGTGAILGTVYGLLLGIVASLAFDVPPDAGYTTAHLAATVALSILWAMTLAASVGGAVPLLCQRVGIDPAVATGPFVTTSVDVIGILSYFLISQALLGL